MLAFIVSKVTKCSEFYFFSQIGGLVSINQWNKQKTKKKTETKTKKQKTKIIIKMKVKFKKVK